MQNIDYGVATPEQIEASIGHRLEAIRISRNVNQTWLANEAGVSRRTISRMENGEGISLDTLIRVLQALQLVERLGHLVPELGVQPVDRIRNNAKPRQRARMQTSKDKTTSREWTWGDEE